LRKSVTEFCKILNFLGLYSNFWQVTVLHEQAFVGRNATTWIPTNESVYLHWHYLQLYYSMSSNKYSRCKFLCPTRNIFFCLDSSRNVRPILFLIKTPNHTGHGKYILMLRFWGISLDGTNSWRLFLPGNFERKIRPKNKICGFPVSRPYLAFGPRNPDPKLFYWIMLVSVST
jgi:hypothetical protein